MQGRDRDFILLWRGRTSLMFCGHKPSGVSCLSRGSSFVSSGVCVIQRVGQTHNWMSQDVGFTLEGTRLFMRRTTGDESEERQGRRERSRNLATERAGPELGWRQGGFWGQLRFWGEYQEWQRQRKDPAWFLCIQSVVLSTLFGNFPLSKSWSWFHLYISAECGSLNQNVCAEATPSGFVLYLGYATKAKGCNYLPWPCSLTFPWPLPSLPHIRVLLFLVHGPSLHCRPVAI